MDNVDSDVHSCALEDLFMGFIVKGVSFNDNFSKLSPVLLFAALACGRKEF